LSDNFDPDTVTREELGAAMTGADTPDMSPRDDGAATSHTDGARPHTDRPHTDGPRADTDEGGPR
jgi:hypothetical protein